MPEQNEFTAMVQSGRELRKRWLTYDPRIGSIRDGTGKIVAAAKANCQVAADMVAAYNESIART